MHYAWHGQKKKINRPGLYYAWLLPLPQLKSFTAIVHLSGLSVMCEMHSSYSQEVIDQIKKKKVDRLFGGNDVPVRTNDSLNVWLIYTLLWVVKEH